MEEKLASESEHSDKEEHVLIDTKPLTECTVAPYSCNDSESDGLEITMDSFE